VRGFSPLDEELKLLPGDLTPSLQRSLVRLGTSMEFESAAKFLEHFTQTQISEATARRNTERAGAAYERAQLSELGRLERELPRPPRGPAVQQLSVDGAMVPLVGGEWAEVKTAAIGTVGEPRLERGERVAQTTELSYFSRLTDSDTFGRVAGVELHRRGTETAGIVLAVVDGADWVQGFMDVHRPDAVRILDFPLAAGYVSNAAQAVYGPGTEAASEWLSTQLHELKYGKAETVLDALRGLGDKATGGAGETVRVSLQYLHKRIEQIRYGEFQALGYPIGSGIVESGHKVVVEARLKGAGMHWARHNVNPMCALRNIECNDRWAEAWPRIVEQIRAEQRENARERRRRRSRAKRASEERAVEPVPATAPVVAPHPASPPEAEPVQVKAAKPGTADPRKPAPNHPWRRFPINPTRRPSDYPPADANH